MSQGELLPRGTPEVICIGESMVMVTPVDATPLDRAVDVKLAVGGAESTVALYLSELGHQVAWVSRVGDDPLGQRIATELAHWRVDTTYVTRDAQAPTGVYFKDPRPEGTTIFYYRKGSAASGMSFEDLLGVPLCSARVVHLSGITPALSRSCRQLVERTIEALADTSTRVSFDVNFRPQLWEAQEAAPVLLSLCQRADIVFVGQDEANALWGTRTPKDVHRLLACDGTLLVKADSEGVTEFSDGRQIFAPAPEVDVVEPVGAGDAFAAGYLSAVLRNSGPEECLESGHKIAGRALQATADFVANAPRIG